MKLNIAKDELDFAQKSTLNEDFWQNEKLNPKVRKVILAIVKNYLKSTNLRLSIDDIDEIEFTGSLANYNHNKFSDVDIHLLFDFSELGNDPDFMRELLTAKAINWNNRHNVTIFGHEVELYIADAKSDHHSTGVYSVKDDKWLIKPVKDAKLSAELNLNKVKDKADKISKQIDMLAVKDDVSLEKIESLKDKIKKMRESGLETGGEYSTENLAFKLLRRRGELNTLYALMNQAQDEELSLDEGTEWWKKRRKLDNKNYRELMGYVRGAKVSKKGKPYMVSPQMKLPKSGPPGVGALEEETKTVERKIQLSSSTPVDTLFDKYIDRGTPVTINFYADDEGCLDEHSYVVQREIGFYSVNLVGDLKNVVKPSSPIEDPRKCLYRHVGRENSGYAVLDMFEDIRKAGSVKNFEVTVFEKVDVTPPAPISIEEPTVMAPTQSLFVKKVKRENGLIRLSLVPKKEIYFTNFPDFVELFKVLFKNAVKEASSGPGGFDPFKLENYLKFLSAFFNPIKIYKQIKDIQPKNGYGYVYYDQDGKLKKYYVELKQNNQAKTQTESLEGVVLLSITEDVENQIKNYESNSDLEEKIKKHFAKIVIGTIKSSIKSLQETDKFSKKEWLQKIDEKTDLNFCQYFDCKKSKISVSKDGKPANKLTIAQYLRGGTFVEKPSNVGVFITLIVPSEEKELSVDMIWADDAEKFTYLDSKNKNGIVDLGLKKALLAILSQKYKSPVKQEELLAQQAESLAREIVIKSEKNLINSINTQYKKKCPFLRTSLDAGKDVQETILSNPEVKKHIPWSNDKSGTTSVTIECEDKQGSKQQPLEIKINKSNFKGNIQDTGLLFKVKIGDIQSPLTHSPLEIFALKKLLNDFGLKYGFKKYDNEDTWFMPRKTAEQWRVYNPGKDYTKIGEKELENLFTFPQSDVTAKNFNEVTTPNIRTEMFKLARAAQKYFGDNLRIAITEAQASTGHVGKSQHYSGNAVDYYFEGIAGAGTPQEKYKIAYCFTLAAMAKGIISKGGLGIYFRKGEKALSDKPHYDTRGSDMAWKKVGGKKSTSTAATKYNIIFSEKNPLKLPQAYRKLAAQYYKKM